MTFREQIDEYKLKGAGSFKEILPEILLKAQAPDSKKDYINFAVDICIDLKEYETTISLLNLRDSRFGFSDVGYNQQAFCCWELEQEDIAYKNYERSLMLNPENVSSQRGACYLAIETKHDQEAVEH